MRKPQLDGTLLIKLDPLLKPYASQLRERFAHFQRFKAQIENSGGVLGEITQGHRYFGFTVVTTKVNRGYGTVSGHREQNSYL